MLGFYVAGVKHYQSSRALKKFHNNSEIKEGTQLTLRREPCNPYDPNAVQILKGEEMLGYVPAKFSAQVAALLELGECECNVLTFDPSEDPWKSLMVEINLKEEKSQDA